MSTSACNFNLCLLGFGACHLLTCSSCIMAANGRMYPSPPQISLQMLEHAQQRGQHHRLGASLGAAGNLDTPEHSAWLSLSAA